MTTVEQARNWPDYKATVNLVAGKVCPNKAEGPCIECVDDAERFLIGRLDHRIDHGPLKQAAKEVVADAL